MVTHEIENKKITFTNGKVLYRLYYQVTGTVPDSFKSVMSEIDAFLKKEVKFKDLKKWMKYGKGAYSNRKRRFSHEKIQKIHLQFMEHKSFDILEVKNYLYEDTVLLDFSFSQFVFSRTENSFLDSLALFGVKADCFRILSDNAVMFKKVSPFEKCPNEKDFYEKIGIYPIFDRFF